MTYLRRRNVPEAAQKRFIAAVLCAIAVIAALSFFPVPRLSGAVHRLTRPLWEVRVWMSEASRSFAAFLSSKRSLVEENERLARLVREAEPVRLENVILRDENEALKSELGRTIAEETVLAVVLARPIVSPYDTLIVDVGRAKDVLPGDLVLSDTGIAIGTVTVSHTDTSVVTLFSSPGLETQVFIGPRAVSAVAVGRGGGNFAVKLPRGIGIEEGDAITMPGINPKIFAVAERTVERPADPLQTVLFKNPVNFLELRFVEVVRSGRTP